MLRSSKLLIFLKGVYIPILLGCLYVYVCVWRRMRVSSKCVFPFSSFLFCLFLYILELYIYAVDVDVFGVYVNVYSIWICVERWNGGGDGGWLIGAEVAPAHFLYLLYFYCPFISLCVYNIKVVLSLIPSRIWPCGKCLCERWKWNVLLRCVWKIQCILCSSEKGLIHKIHILPDTV